MTRYRAALLVVMVAVTGLVVLTLNRAPTVPAPGSASALVAPPGERVPAPSFTGIDRWINSPPLTLAGLRGRVVLVDFWTFSCVNCVRTLPHLRALYHADRAAGLVVVGVHSPEFDFEKSPANVAAAVSRLGVDWPVALDSEMQTWNAYGNLVWPAEYLIDQSGRIAYTHQGEGDYEQTDAAVAALLGIRPAGQTSGSVPGSGISPELYAGSERGQLADGAAFAPLGGSRAYPDSGPPRQRDRIQVTGTWVDRGQYLEAAGPGHVRLRFHAGSVFVVAGSAGVARQVGVTLDGHPVPESMAGRDLRHSQLTVARQDLYTLLQGVSAGDHLLDLTVPAGFQLFTFTFG